MEEEIEYNLNDYSNEDNILFELSNLYDQKSKESAIEMFKQKSDEERKSIVHAFLNLYNPKEKYPRTQEAHSFYFNIAVNLNIYKEIFASDLNYEYYVFDYITKNKCYKFNDIDKNFFSNIIVSSKEYFLKLFNVLPCKDFLENNLIFDFNEEEKKDIKNIIDYNHHLNIKNVNLKKKIFNKIGFYNTFLDFSFDENSTQEDFDLFFQNINLFKEEQLLNIAVNNFFSDIFCTRASLESFRFEEFLHFCNLKPQLGNKINDILKSENKKELKKILNVSKILENKIPLISEKINTALMIQSF